MFSVWQDPEGETDLPIFSENPHKGDFPPITGSDDAHV